jgi:hypothetical protein
VRCDRTVQHREVRSALRRGNGRSTLVAVRRSLAIGLAALGIGVMLAGAVVVFVDGSAGGDASSTSPDSTPTVPRGAVGTSEPPRPSTPVDRGPVESTTSVPPVGLDPPRIVDRFASNVEAMLEAQNEVIGDPDAILEAGELLPRFSRSFAAVIADFNGDGKDDIQLSRHHAARFNPEEADGVWLATEDGYRLSWEMVRFVDRHGCGAGDVNGDGAVDLYCTRGAFRGATTLDPDGNVKTKSNELLLNRGDGTFVDVTIEWGVADPRGRGREALLFDYDNDGRLDLYLLNASAPSDVGRSENRLFHNEGERFVEIDGPLTGEHGYQCPVVTDWNRDGWQDVLVCKGGRPRLFQNGPDGFRDLTSSLLPDGRNWRHAVAADLDGDGSVDLAVARRDAVELWRFDDESGEFERAWRRAFTGEGRWVAVGDFFGDTHLDFYVVTAGIDCVDPDTPAYNGDDYLLIGPGYDLVVRASHGLGCGDRVYPIDGTRLLILNGAAKSRGPVEVVDLRTSPTPLAREPAPVTP